MPSIDDSGGNAARVKVKYLIEKWIDDEGEGGAWLPMARFSIDSEPERRLSLCEALGGQVRMIDVELMVEVELPRKFFE